MRTHPEQGAAPRREDPAELMGLYREYRRREGYRLLSLLPRDGLRNLYSRARTEARRRGTHDPKDPMADLLEFVDRVLPLPPFEVWREDVTRNPVAHLESPGAEGGSASSVVPVTVDVRTLRVEHRRWMVDLRVFPHEGVWRGFLSFRTPEREGPVRTADIFREESAEVIRTRFRELRADTLRAFHRSALP